MKQIAILVLLISTKTWAVIGTPIANCQIRQGDIVSFFPVLKDYQAITPVSETEPKVFYVLHRDGKTISIITNEGTAKDYHALRAVSAKNKVLLSDNLGKFEQIKIECKLTGPIVIQ